MKTNNEDFLDDRIRKLEEKLHDEYSVSPLAYVQLESLIEKKAIDTTTNEIFDELDKIIRGKSTIITLHRQRQILFGFKDYEAVKKKYLLRTRLHPQRCNK